jgi:small-conductance mechanosensitive channel/CRP-like cAMP-binding protein
MALAGGVWLAGAWLAIRLVDLVFWDHVVRPRLGAPVPALLKDVLAFVLILLAIGGFVGITLGYSVTGLWATSGVLGIVIGLALQSMIADVFSGIAINVDRPFSIGHWIRVQPRGADTLVGCVEEVSWRATRLRTIDNVMHIIPNNLLSVTTVTNLSLPETTSRFELHFCVDFSVPSERVLRILNAGVRGAEGVLEDPAPKARIEGVGLHGVEYHVYYWLRPDLVSPRKGRHRVAASVLQHLSAAGIALAHPKQELTVGAQRKIELDPERDRAAIVRRISLFASLDDDEIALLAASIAQRRFDAGDVVIEKDAPGDSMFFVVEGLLYVLAAVDGREEPVRVGQIGAGAFFGEMSLLTGEPRSATLCAATEAVAFEITRDDLRDLFAQRPEVVKEIAKVVARRQAERSEALDRATADELRAETASLSERIFERISRFFGGANGRSA